uniref:Uncharacterized protein n=1 Tax=Anguilla anguilla TaxID=7936 RepID=A0A0E9SQ19_ANGAN
MAGMIRGKGVISALFLLTRHAALC